MDLGLGALIADFRRLEPAGTMVLGTIVETAGSTYRKRGAMMLFDAAGNPHGLLSGGCLESDLAGHAMSVQTSGKPLVVVYDMRVDDQAPWGLGLGCGGMVRILLQRIGPQDDFARLGPLAELLRRRGRGLIVRVWSSSLDALPVGATLLGDEENRWHGRDGCPDADRLIANLPETRPQRAESLELHSGQGHASFLVVPVDPPAELLVCGAGPDAAPLVRLAREIGWRVCVADHRPAYIEQIRNAGPDVARVVRPESLGSAGLIDQADAIMVMTHQLETDRTAVRQALAGPARYIGLLGPAARRELVLDGLAGADRRRVRGPAGLDIGAELPETIALSILSEAHGVLKGRDGRPLSWPVRVQAQ